MKLGITSKLIIAVTATAMLAIVIMALFTRYSFRHGFLEYVNAGEVRSLSRLSDKLLELYEENGGWDFIRANPREGRRLLRSLGREVRHHHAMPMPMPQHMPGPDMGLPLLNRLSLLDEHQQYLTGNRKPGANAKLVAVRNNDNAIIAWIRYAPASRLSETVDIQFQQSQTNAIITIGLISILLATMIAMMLARQFLNPIKRIVTATRKLTAGELDTRIAINSEDELGQLTRDFNTLAQTLSEQEHARQQWLADISHELRTPVAVLRGEIEALQDGVRKPDQNSLSSLHNEVLHINKLIDDLYQLSLSDIGALDYKMTPLNIVEVIHQVIDSFTGACREKALEVSSDLDKCNNITLLGDEQRLRQLFNNIMSNSLRYTDSHGKIEIYCETIGDKINIQWMDSAPGVSQALLPKLFDRLFRVDPSRARKSGGAGLGLSLCKNIVHAHNGSINAAPSSLGGLCVTISLPIEVS